MNQRQPNPNDLVVLTRALATFGVAYALIGGTAMAVHGFSRATKDIDLLLPVDADNNTRLLQALASIEGNAEALTALRREWMDKGHSTALEGEIYVDLLYVAASQSYEGLKAHIQTVVFDGVPVVTLDVDGMLLTKRTQRESDIPDRLKLERLRSAMRLASAHKNSD
jgi:Nucleotidyl transferase AbiEii toxin, Type IV TA system